MTFERPTLERLTNEYFASAEHLPWCCESLRISWVAADLFRVIAVTKDGKRHVKDLPGEALIGDLDEETLRGWVKKHGPGWFGFSPERLDRLRKKYYERVS
jgi:hypothetical protein